MSRPFLTRELLRNKKIQIRFTKEEKKQIEEICKKEKVTFSKLIKDALFFKHNIKLN
jgi:hypothetical protein